jgi:hypothetical protein
MKNGIVWFNLVEVPNESLMINAFAWSTVYEICGGEKSLILELQWHGGAG